MTAGVKPFGSAFAAERSQAADALSLPADWPNRTWSRQVATSTTDFHIQRAGAGPGLLLIHGTGSATHTWRDVMPLLAADYDVIALDLPGHGYSGWPRFSRFSLDNFAAAVRDLVTALNVYPAAIVGHSAGAAIAFRLGIDGHFERSRLVALNGALEPYGGMSAPLFKPIARAAAMTPFLAAAIGRRARDAGVVRRMLSSTGSPLDQHGVRHYQELLSRETHVRATIRMMADWDISGIGPALRPIASRCHLVAATGDLAVPAVQARRLSACHPGLGLSEIDGLGHLAHEEAAERVTRHLRAAIEGDSDGSC